MSAWSSIDARRAKHGDQKRRHVRTSESSDAHFTKPKRGSCAPNILQNAEQLAASFACHQDSVLDAQWNMFLANVAKSGAVHISGIGKV